MIVNIFNRHAKASAKGPVQYLLSEHDHTGKKRTVAPVVLEGDPATTDKLIDSLAFEHTYVAGCISFRYDERPTAEQKHECMREFERCFMAGLARSGYNILWVEHQDKGRVELNFVVPRVELSTMKSMNIHPPGKKNIDFFHTFEVVMNDRFGYDQIERNPEKLKKNGYELKILAQTLRGGKPIGKAQKEKVHEHLVQKVKAGDIRNRVELIDYMKSRGSEFSRTGDDYISLRSSTGKNVRFKGYIYENNGGANYDLSRVATPHLTPQQRDHAQQKLLQHTLERAAFNHGRYSSSRRDALRPKANPPTDRSVYAGGLARRITKERLRPDMGMKQGTYTAKVIGTVLMGKNVERVQFNGAGDILVKKDIADNATKNAIQPFKAKVAQPRASTLTQTPQAASKPSGGVPTTHGTDLTSVNLSIGNLQGALIEAAAKGDIEGAAKIKQQIAQLEAQKRELIRQANDRTHQEQLRALNSAR
ncbi:relaxase/mobilization nuclease domain-containing protein [Paraburkholderia tropica]|uniref:relaxase/mobilization nuclease domain-containing protein n=1 Tax=Paraburkholderia tropica TaxID=92647 RepID=UPI002AB61C3F|nr:relaxase/mobilization nuclease domain-containing protein [Paraburkholderia tropica]